MDKIAAALVKAQKAFGPALKSSSNPHFKSRYADLAACVEAVIDALNENGVFVTQRTHEWDGGVAVETVFVHESGEIWSAGILRIPAQKNDPQGYGSALTYARRYQLQAACGIAPEDDDGNAAQKTTKAQPKPDPKPAEAKKTGPEMVKVFVDAGLIPDTLDALEAVEKRLGHPLSHDVSDADLAAIRAYYKELTDAKRKKESEAVLG